jgi:hypothetical protein
VKVRPFANPAMLVTTGEVLARLIPATCSSSTCRAAGILGRRGGDGPRRPHPFAIHIPYNLALVDPDAPRKRMAKEPPSGPAWR